MKARAPGREWIAGVGLGAGLALAVARVPAAVPAGLAALALVALPVALGLAIRSDSRERRVLLGLFLGAVAVRAALALVVAYAVPDGFFALDDRRYELLGAALARHWEGEGPLPALHPPVGYYVWNGLLFRLFGPHGLVPALVNAAVGGLSVLLVHGLAREVAGPGAARVAAALAAFWPSLVLWSSLNLKDACVLLSILLLLRGAQKLQGGLSLGAVSALAAGALGIGQLRSYLLLVAGCALAMAWLLPRLRGAQAPLGMALLLAVGALGAPVVGSVGELAEEVSFESLDRARQDLALGGSAYYGDADVSSPSKALRFLPLGLAYFLLAPAPWQVWNARQVLTLPEMLAWYALIPFVAIGIVHALRTRLAASLPILAFLLFVTVSYALVESNLGTAYRHRAQVMVLFLLFGAVGIVVRRGRRGAHSEDAPAGMEAQPA